MSSLGAAFSVVAMTAAMALAARWLGVARINPAAVTNPQAAPFLGGSAPDTHAWSRFHVRYYAVVLLFVAFEMEMMFMYPWAVVFVEEGIKALVEMGMFLASLSLGILYAWKEGAFKWQ